METKLFLSPKATRVGSKYPPLDKEDFDFEEGGVLLSDRVDGLNEYNHGARAFYLPLLLKTSRLKKKV